MIDHLAVQVASEATRQWVRTRTRIGWEEIRVQRLPERGRRVPASDGVVERADDVVLLLSVAPALDVRTKVVEPPEPAALAAAVQP
jgi:hypothetical protein